MKTYLPTTPTEYAHDRVKEHATKLRSLNFGFLAGFISLIRSFIIDGLTFKEKKVLISGIITWNLIIKSITVFIGTIWLLIILVTIF